VNNVWHRRADYPQSGELIHKAAIHGSDLCDPPLVLGKVTPSLG
jgi:hypothetical protein